MIIEEDDLIGSLYEAKDVLGYIHFSENNRLIPGLGSIDFINITKALKKIGYEGCVALECVPHPNIDITGPLGANYIKVISNLLNINF
jgi:sugar phosphate isomerase/epimerase